MVQPDLCALLTVWKQSDAQVLEMAQQAVLVLPDLLSLLKHSQQRLDQVCSVR